MKQIFDIRNFFLIPIFLVIVLSLFHVVYFFEISNPKSWAIYLSVAVEIFAISSIVAISLNLNKISVWILFVLVTIIQFVGNIFFSFYYIDTNSNLFKSFSEFFGIFYSADNFESEKDFILFQKVVLSFFSGGIIPILSMISLNFYISSKYVQKLNKSLDGRTVVKNANVETPQNTSSRVDVSNFATTTQPVEKNQEIYISRK